jgi:hypothetical protein
MGIRRRRTDHNQAGIARALQRCGWHVTDLSGCGGGVPDLLLTRAGQCCLVEIKNMAGRGKRFTAMQLDYYQQIQAPVYVLSSINDVESMINGLIKPINADTSPKKARTLDSRKD